MSKISITKLGAACSIAIMFAQPVMAEGLYQDFGEKAGLTKMVHEFIGVVASDKRINNFFKDTDLVMLQEQLVDQFCEATGGGCKYTGGDMKKIHSDMGVNTANFNALVEDLQAAMTKQGISSSTQNKLLAKLAPLQRDIVTK